ncbi:MAG: helix-turn-helix domain-containing protein [Pseudomonadota bacterium]
MYDPHMETMIIGMHSASFALLGVLAVLVTINQLRSITGKLLMSLCVTLMALMISTLPSEANLPPALLWTARILDVPNTVLAWLFVKSMLEDEFRIQLKHLFVSLLYCLGAWSLWLNHWIEWTPYIVEVSWVINLSVLALFLRLLVQIWKQRRDDLLHKRRQFRLVFVLLVTGTVSVSIISEIFVRSISPEAVDLNKMLITLSLVILGFLWLARIPASHIAFLATLPQPEGAKPVATDKAKAILARIDQCMEEEELWRDPSLSLPELAKAVGVGEKRLRTLINEHLGYRNFPAFVASYRIEAVKAMIRDERKRDDTVSSLAFSCGFNSLASFNRLFKQSEGVSPLEYRTQNLSIASN